MLCLATSGYPDQGTAAVFWPGDGAEVVAQCANAAGGGWFLDGAAAGGCDPGLDADDESLSITNGRADDEAFNTEVELNVEF